MYSWPASGYYQSNTDLGVAKPMKTLLRSDFGLENNLSKPDAISLTALYGRGGRLLLNNASLNLLWWKKLYLC